MTATLIDTSKASIDRAAAALRDGRLVAFPTETVYGLGGIATDGRAVASIYAAKGRPDFNPLIAHVQDVDAARRLVVLDDLAERLAAAFWPGPLTLVLPRASGCPVSPLCSAGLPTLAIRVPAAPVAQALLRATGLPVAAPSANPSGRLSPTTAAHVMAGLGDRLEFIIDGGPCPVGVESTVVGVAGGVATLLRPGGLAAEEIEAVTGRLLRPGHDPAAPSSPGMLASHYAPRAALRLNAHEAGPGEILLGFGPEAPAGPNLSPTGDLVEAAARLFGLLHDLDGTDGRTIAVMPVPERGLGLAINDRLRRAAAPRGA